MASPKRNPKIPKTITKTINKSDPLFSLKKKLAVCELEVKNYVRALEAENFKLADQVGKLQAENMTLNNRVKSLLKQIEEIGPSHVEMLQSVHKSLFANDLKNHNTSKGLNKKG